MFNYSMENTPGDYKVLISAKFKAFFNNGVWWMGGSN